MSAQDGQEFQVEVGEGLTQCPIIMKFDLK